MMAQQWHLWQAALSTAEVVTLRHVTTIVKSNQCPAPPPFYVILVCLQRTLTTTKWRVGVLEIILRLKGKDRGLFSINVAKRLQFLSGNKATVQYNILVLTKFITTLTGDKHSTRENGESESQSQSSVSKEKTKVCPLVGIVSVYIATRPTKTTQYASP